MNQFDNTKQLIRECIINSVIDKKYILSTTIVGSFNNSNGLEGISDIDIVIIVNELNELKFNEIITTFKQLDPSSFNLNNYNIYVNETFGPLKFNTSKNIVFHVMIYDIDGHVLHVNKSPFTCYSWEKNQPLTGLSLREIFPVVSVQYSDFIESRRGVLSYIEDLKKGAISFRKYAFENQKPIVVKDYFTLDKELKYEYSYHITFNLLRNFYSILDQKDDKIKVNELIENYKTLDSGLKSSLDFFEELFAWKKKNGVLPENINNRTILFIQTFYEFTEKFVKKNSIRFQRHQKTKLNDGSFLGVKRDPSIDSKLVFHDETPYEIGYHSELKRSIETIKYYNCNKLKKSSLLNEIDYGKAEGLNIKELSEKFPEIILKWTEGKDPKFPEGENQKDVIKRTNFFLNEIYKNKKKSIVVTHLVVLRMIIFQFSNIPLNNIFKIEIDHLESFDFQFFKDYLIPNFELSFRIKLRRQLSLFHD